MKMDIEPLELIQNLKLYFLDVPCKVIVLNIICLCCTEEEEKYFDLFLINYICILMINNTQRILCHNSRVLDLRDPHQMTIDVGAV